MMLSYFSWPEACHLFLNSSRTKVCILSVTLYAVIHEKRSSKAHMLIISF